MAMALRLCKIRHLSLHAIRRLAHVIGLQPTPKAVEQQIERMHKAGASYCSTTKYRT